MPEYFVTQPRSATDCSPQGLGYIWGYDEDHALGEAYREFHVDPNVRLLLEELDEEGTEAPPEAHRKIINEDDDAEHYEDGALPYPKGEDDDDEDEEAPDNVCSAGPDKRKKEKS